jgi:hypothetical protein
MKLINDILYIEWREAIEAELSENTLRNAKLRKSPSWEFIDDPEDKRRVLIRWSKMSGAHKEKIEKKFGNPYQYMAKEPIRKLIKFDHAAEEFFLNYRYDGNKTLPIEHVKKYSVAASTLNMLKEHTADKKQLKKLLNLTIEEFYLHVLEIIEHDSIDLPTSYKRLFARRKEYEEKGYACLIDWRFGNKLAAKIKDDESQAALLEMIGHNYQFDSVLIANQYNKEFAKKNGYKKITPATVGVWKRKSPEVVIEREGNAAFRKKFIPDVRGKRPTVYAMVESDDNHLDFLFMGYKRFFSIWVIDSYNNMPLAYTLVPFGTLNEGETIELIKDAYTKMMYYVRYMVGDGNWYLPGEIKTDRWALSALSDFYKSIANYEEPVAKSVNRGYVEHSFGTVHWKRCQKLAALKEGNWSGNNVTSATRGVNVEMLDKNAKNFPAIEQEGARQVAQFAHLLRHWHLDDQISLEQQWKEAWLQLPEEHKRRISDEQFLLKFGTAHVPKNNSANRISKNGLDVQISNELYRYDVPGGVPMELVSKEITVYYDKFDMSRVLLTNHRDIRLMAYDARISSRTIQDWDVQSEHYLNDRFAEKMRTVKKATGKLEKRKQLLELANIDAEALLQGGVMVKEIKQAAEQKMLNNTIDEEIDIYKLS